MDAAYGETWKLTRVREYADILPFCVSIEQRWPGFE